MEAADNTTREGSLRERVTLSELQRLQAKSRMGWQAEAMLQRKISGLGSRSTRRRVESWPVVSSEPQWRR